MKQAIIFLVFCVLYLLANAQQEELNEWIQKGCPNVKPYKCKPEQFTEEHKAYREQYLEKAIANSCYEEGTCNTFGLPLTYNAYHLNGKTINMDGRLDEEAWAEVPWTETFVDMRGADFPTPYFETKVKVRWDDERLYIGAYMQETDFWGTLTEDESQIWWENSFIAYVVPDNSMHNYKEMQINVLNATWDLLIKKPYIDTDCHIRTGNDCPAVENADSSWFSGQVRKVYTDGGINDPNHTGTFWSIEWSFTFEALSNHTGRLQPRPNVGETWFADFLRAQYHVKVVNGTYVQDFEPGFDAWAWQPTYDEDPHFPETFGLVQFKTSLEDTQFSFERWHLYKALFEVFNAQKRNRILKREYSMDLYKTEVAPIVLSNMCADVRMVSASDDAFEATAKSRIDPSLPVAHIREDRFVWFTDN